MSPSLLVELFTEELPPKALRQLGEAFGSQLQDGLVRAQLKDRGPGDARIFATPRRLAVLIPDVRSKGLDRTESKKLMPSKVAFGADGKPTAALAKRLKKENCSADELERRIEGDAEYAFLNQTIAGVTLTAGLQTALQEAIAKLPIPRIMSYQLADGATTVQFVRPAHGLVALHGGDIVDVSVLGLKAGRLTHGHRFQGVRDIAVATADGYEEALAAHGQVIASFGARRDETERQLRAKAAELGASLGPEQDVAPLLDEVTALVEHPSVYFGEFEREFLAVPQECLILTMRQNQKYFPLFDAAGKLTNKFLIVSNMRLTDPGNIVEGNQRVIGPRLEDARFFYKQDRKQRLEERVPQLARVVYHNKLGSQLERVERIQLLAGRIARQLGADAVQAERAAWLAKADLLTNMVGEFPQLQGVMGMYYARHENEPEPVAKAICQHYWPRFAGDHLPEDGVAIAVGLADKLDAIVGMYAIGQVPTGDKDPLGLRRQALGIVRMLVERSLELNLGSDLLEPALAQLQLAPKGKLYDELFAFIQDRLRSYLRERDFLADEIESVINQTPYLNEMMPLLHAAKAFKTLAEGRTLAAAHKRIRNILKTAGPFGQTEPQLEIMQEPAEKELFLALRQAPGGFHIDQATQRLKDLALFGPKVDAFFDQVMVMDKDELQKNNRIALLRRLEGLMNQVVDISKLAA
ncbi:MAG: glycine--tRNA ligase subunit beta [Betaproteobacteria bacterium RIFCSPLOWO2_12_FULL_64_23]|nr:MAG: glycine--tRNA ligase subunit beta [Betaproteobacteria bacterium RIFCSPLOWO2_12_FULL_64_23]